MSIFAKFYLVLQKPGVAQVSLYLCKSLATVNDAVLKYVLEFFYPHTFFMNEIVHLPHYLLSNCVLKQPSIQEEKQATHNYIYFCQYKVKHSCSVLRVHFLRETIQDASCFKKFLSCERVVTYFRVVL